MTKKILLSFLLLIIFGSTLQSQDKALYLQHQIPQSIALNPGIYYQCRNYIGIPVLSAIKLNIGNTGFGFHNLVREGPNPQLQPLVFDVENLEKRLSKNNFFKTQLTLGIVDVGFMIKDYFVTFSITNHTDMRLSYPRSLIEFRYGNWNVETREPVELSLTNTALNLINYTKVGLSASKNIANYLSVGARINYIKGTMGLNTPRSRTNLETRQDPIAWNFTTDYRIRSSFPVHIDYDSSGYIENINFDRIFDNPVQTFLFNKNHGISVDVGGVYQYDSRTTLSASILDLGFIRWKSNTNILQARGSFDYAGLDIDKFNANGNNQDIIEDVLDSIGNQFTVGGSNDAYYQLLPLKIFAGADYELVKNLSAGITTKTEIFNKKIRPQLGLHLFYSPINFVTVSTHYSVMNNKLSEFGFGTSIGNRGFQFYFVSDHIPIKYSREINSGILFPYNSRTINFQFGLNIIWGCSKKKEKNLPCAVYD